MCNVSGPLLRWYTKNKRDLPWRRTADPYRIWVSEIMLQQTQVAQVIPYYERFLSRFSTIHALAAAHEDDVLKIWEGLGYYRRARFMHSAARLIVKNYNGRIPDDYDSLMSLPGFGPYTCGSVLSIAFNLPYPAVDGNVLRLISRLFRIESDITRSTTKQKVEDIVGQLFPKGRASDFSQALMEIGSLICTPSQPKCHECPCRKICRAFLEMPNPAVLPVKPKKPARHRISISAAIIKKGNKVLVAKRSAHVILGNLWEFPGGRIERNETSQEACVREIKQKTGLRVRPISLFDTVKHQYSHYGIVIDFFLCRCGAGSVKGKRLRWVKIDELEQLAFSKVHKQIAVRLMAEYRK